MPVTKFVQADSNAVMWTTLNISENGRHEAAIKTCHQLKRYDGSEDKDNSANKELLTNAITTCICTYTPESRAWHADLLSGWKRRPTACSQSFRK